MTQLDGWTPIRLYWREARPVIDWCYTGEQRLSAPFFDADVERLLQRPFNLLFRRQTPVEALAELEAARPGLPPSGFIFHMSRCGSTLVVRMLGALPGASVISEAGIIDAVLRAHLRDPRIDDEQRAAWLRWLIGALGQRRRGDERAFFVKFDPWNTLDMPLIQRAFPGVPWTFIYRDPVPVIVSHMRHRAGRMLPGPVEAALLGLDFGAALQMPPEEYCARMLARFCEAALRHRQPGARLINYRELPEVVVSSLLDDFGVAHTAADRERLREVARYDAKRPAARYEDDSAAKEREASEELRGMAEQWVRPLYDRLEAARLEQAARESLERR